MTQRPLVFASGTRPATCRDGHPWTGKGTMLVGWMPCNCKHTSSTCRGHHTISCRYPGCALRWHDPPHDQATASGVR